MAITGTVRIKQVISATGAKGYPENRVFGDSKIEKLFLDHSREVKINLLVFKNSIFARKDLPPPLCPGIIQPSAVAIPANPGADPCGNVFRRLQTAVFQGM
jgi:hypothetical protein